MIKTLLFWSIIFFTVNSYSQNQFENGYFVDNNGVETKCLIKNIDWYNNPTSFKYKITEDSEVKIGNLNNSKKFGIDNHSEFERFTVDVDHSSNDLKRLTSNRTPVFKNETIFLKLIFKGNDVKLYELRAPNLLRYFFTAPNVDIEQLIYKRFITSNNQIVENNRYKQQLWLNLKCKNVSMKVIEKTDYSGKDLRNYFQRYNECRGFKNPQVHSKETKGLLNLSIRPRVSSNSLSINKPGSFLTYERSVDFGNSTNLSLGIELEYILPFNNNKWGIFIEPNFQSFKKEKEFAFNSGFTTTNFIVDYKTINIPLGVRHYLFLNDNSKLFINAAFALNIDINSSLFDDINRFTDEFEVSPSTNHVFGLGYSYNNTYSVEMRLNLNNDILDSMSWYSDLSTVSLIVGYNLFGNK